MSPIKTLIMGAAGRDFHNFNVFYRDNKDYEVVAFTATQIPNIEGRKYPAELAGSLYPAGIPIYPESELVELIRKLKVDQVVFAYSDVPHEVVMHKASTVLAAGADFRLMGVGSTQVKSVKPVVSVCAVRTGAGKSQTTRRVSLILRDMGYKVAAIRHPMPYGDLEKQAVQRFATMADLDLHKCTIEEREEYAPHIERGNVVFAGVDYEAIMHEVEKEADVLLWDGGNNDIPFYQPDLHITLADPHRPGHEMAYYPGEVNARAADVVILNKCETAKPEFVEQVRQSIMALNPKASIILANSPMTADNPELIRGRRVLVVEDGPTLTHGEMGYGAGLLAARQYGAGEIIDPRPFAVGSLKATFEKWAHLGPVLPAMGYSEKQCDELRQSIAASQAEAVVIGTPIDLGAVIEIGLPSTRIRYELEEKSGPALSELLKPVIEKARKPVASR